MKKMVPIVGLALAQCITPVYSINTQANENKPVVRFYSNNQVSQDTTTSNLGVFEYKDFGLGYERFDNGNQFFGVQIPAEKVIGIDADMYVHVSDLENNKEEYEFIGNVKPGETWGVVARIFDAYKDGFALATNYRKNNFDAPNNLAAGIGFTRRGNESDIAVYGWEKFAGLKGLYFGAGTFSRDERFVVGISNPERFSWRYFRIDADSFKLNEFLFTTEDRNLRDIDAFEALYAGEVDATDSFTTNGGVFRYIVPPNSALGRGWTGGITHTKNYGKDSLKMELVRYFGDFFLGNRYEAAIDNFDKGIIGIPCGYQFSGGDGLTRNFLRIMPTYNISDNSGGVRIQFEYKF